jgi:hypothetical protein
MFMLSFLLPLFASPSALRFALTMQTDEQKRAFMADRIGKIDVLMGEMTPEQRRNLTPMRQGLQRLLDIATPGAVLPSTPEESTQLLTDLAGLGAVIELAKTKTKK